MTVHILKPLTLTIGMALVGAAHADLAPAGNLGVITAPASLAFSNAAVTVGTTTTTGSGASAITYNFLDQWKFTLASQSNVSTLAAAINFTNPAGDAVIFGISNLQVNLVTDPASGPPLVSWLTVSVPITGLQQVVALIPTAPLAAGNYTLDIRGTVSQPGSYSGSLIANAPAAVPLPAALPLLAAGLASFGVVGRRRKAGTPGLPDDAPQEGTRLAAA